MEYTNLVTAAMSLIGTLAGTFGGIMVSNRLSNYRIGQLEEKVATIWWNGLINWKVRCRRPSMIFWT